MNHVGMHSPINKTAGAKADAGAAPGQSRRRKHDKPSKLRNLRGRKYIKRLGHLIHTLRHTHPHPNRQVDFDDVVTILLLGFYNADIRSLRKLELYSQVPGVGENLRVERICRSTLSEGLKLFDPALLAPLMEQLYKELPNRHCLNPEFQDLYEKLIAFDGSYFRVPAQVHWALRERNSQQVPGRQVRLNLHYCVGTGNPVGLSISGEGGASEAEALREIIEPGMIIVADRGTFSFAGVNDIAAGGGHFVFRLKAEVGFTSVSAKSLTDQDRQHRVISDRIGHLTGSPSRTPPLIQVREILIEKQRRRDFVNGSIRFGGRDAPFEGRGDEPTRLAGGRTLRFGRVSAWRAGTHSQSRGGWIHRLIFMGNAVRWNRGGSRRRVLVTSQIAMP